MRELEFEVIHNNKIIGYISMKQSINGGLWFFVDYRLPEEERILNYGLGDLFPPANVGMLDHLSYRQYFGKKDIEGKKLYEGDIIDYPFAEEVGYPTLRRNEIVWYQDRFILSRFSWDGYFWNQMIKLGNRYENPELIG